MATERENLEVSGAPSPRLIADAREKGNWPRSGELVFASVLLAALLVIRFVGGSAATSFTLTLAEQLESIGNVRTPPETVATVRVGLVHGLAALAPVLLIPAAAAIIVSIGQVGMRFSPQAVLPDVTRFNPVGRLGALLSVESAQRSLISLAKWLSLLGLTTYWLWQEVALHTGSIAGEVGGSSAVSLAQGVLRLATKLAVALVVFGLIDYALAWRTWRQQLQPTRAEQLAELKESDGDPRLRQARRQRHVGVASAGSTKQLHAENLLIVGKGRLAVVVSSADPRVARILTKSVGAAADRLQQAARRFGARIVRDSIIARELFRSVPTGELIPSRVMTEFETMLRSSGPADSKQSERNGGLEGSRTQA